jgi:hypothetical protein
MRATLWPTAPVPTHAVGHRFTNVPLIKDTDMLCTTGHMGPNEPRWIVTTGK